MRAMVWRAGARGGRRSRSARGFVEAAMHARHVGREAFVAD